MNIETQSKFSQIATTHIRNIISPHGKYRVQMQTEYPVPKFSVQYNYIIPFS